MLILERFLTQLGEAVTARAADRLADGGPLGDAAGQIAQDACRLLESPEARDAIRAALDVNADEVATVAHRAAAVVPALSDQQRAALTRYLAAVPATIRAGTQLLAEGTAPSIAPTDHYSRPECVARLLPMRLPRFRPGDRPLPGVDRELVELLGMGGFGEVWKARNPHFDGMAPVALKFCLEDARTRMLRHEATVLNQVMRHGTHPGIVALRQTYLDADPPCLEYDFVAGRDLGALIRSHGPANDRHKIAHVTSLVRQLADTVGFMHRLTPPVVHRDLKPANVLLASRERERPEGATPVAHAPGSPVVPKITDFGIGGVSDSSGSLPTGLMTTILRGSFTPLYASPQQKNGETPTPRDDVYSLGVIWYQLLLGDPGRAADSDVDDELQTLSVDERIVALIRRCLSAKAERRPADGCALAGEIAALLEAPALPPPPPIYAPATISGPLAIELGGRTGMRYRVEHYFPFTDVRALDDRLAKFPVAVFLPPNRPPERTPVVIVLQALCAPLSWGAYLVPLLVDRGVGCVMIETPLAGERSLVGSHRGDVFEEVAPLCEAGVSPTGNLLPRLMEAMARDVGTVIRSLLEQRHGLMDRRRAMLGFHFGALLASFAFLRDNAGEKLLCVRGHADLYHFAGPLLIELNPPRDTKAGAWLAALLENVARGGSICRQANPMTFIDRAGDRRVRFLVGNHLNWAKVDNAQANARRFAQGKCHVRPGVERDESLAGRVEEFVSQQLAEWMR